jgi:PAS domain S-box-containing protein
VDIVLNPIHWDQEQVVLAAVRDVTERYRALEESARFAAIMHNASAAIYVQALNGVILNWNQGAERLFGYVAEKIIGKNVSLLIPRDRTGEFGQTVAQLLRRTPLRDYETVRLHQDGRRMDVAMTQSPVEHAGKIVGICTFVRDISDRKRVEQQLVELAEAERARMGSMVHDTLGQQVTAMGMIVSTLKQQIRAGSAQSEALSKLEIIIDATKAQLRSLAKGLFPVDMDASGLRIALEGLAEEVRQVHEIDCLFKSTKPVSIADVFVSTQLYLIAREAVHNAVKHAQAHSIVIQLEDEDGIRLFVRDDGVGMDTDLKQSSGMGVRIMRHRSHLIGGSLEVKSAAGKGTNVRCFLPSKT